MNILDLAMQCVNGLIANKQVKIETIEIASVGGIVQENTTNLANLYAHIQPMTPNEVKKYTDSTLDSAECYKIFFSREDAEVVCSLDIVKKETQITFDNKICRAFGLRDWLKSNGWVCVLVSVKNKL